MSTHAPAPHFLTAVVGAAQPFALGVGQARRPLAGRAQLAGDSRTRRQGLLGRERLDDDEALVIAPTQGVHTFGMRFAIDVVFVDRAGLVVTVAADVRPRRLRVCWRAFAAVEVAAGRCHAASVLPGEHIVAWTTERVVLT